MMPSTGTLVLPNRSIARVASISDRSCGVETITAPAGRDFWTSDSCTSPVPGGRSTRMSSVSPQSPSISWLSAPSPSARATPARGRTDQLADRQQLHALRFDRDQLVLLGLRLSVVRAGSAARGHRCRRRPARPSCPSAPRRWPGWRQRRLADPALAGADGDQGPVRLGDAVSATRASLTPGTPARRVQLALRAPRARAVKPAGIGDDRGDARPQPPRADPVGIGQFVQPLSKSSVSWCAPLTAFRRAALFFGGPPIMGMHDDFIRVGSAGTRPFQRQQGPVGRASGAAADGAAGEAMSRRPVGRTAQARAGRRIAGHLARRFPARSRGALRRRGRRRLRLRRPARPFADHLGRDRRRPAVAAVHLHAPIAPEERGVVTRFGRYSHTLRRASA